MDPKDIYIEEVERIAAGSIEDGIDEDAAYEAASELAYDSSIDRYADMVDTLRQQVKDGY